MQRVWSASSLIGSNQGWINSLPHLSLSLSLSLSVVFLEMVKDCLISSKVEDASLRESAKPEDSEQLMNELFFLIYFVNALLVLLSKALQMTEISAICKYF